MAQVEVRNQQNEIVDKLVLEDDVFDYSASQTLVWEAVRAFQAAQRKGTHATKNRSQVRGGGRKPWRQKGTGRARAGSLRSPLWRSGGITFGPQPRDYRQRFPKKKRRGAVKLVLSDKLKNDRITVLEDLSLTSHQTRNFLQLVKTLDLSGKVLVVDDQDNRNLYLSTRNLPLVKTIRSLAVNVVDLLHHDQLMISRTAILRLQEVLQR